MDTGGGGERVRHIPYARYPHGEDKQTVPKIEKSHLKTLVYSVLFSTRCQCCIHKQVMTKAQRP